MLFAIKYHPRSNRTAEDARLARDLFVAWNPPASVEIRDHYHFVSGGGILIADTESPTALYESVEPFKPMVDFDLEPVVNVIEAIAISMDIDEWLASTKHARN
jgi:hypothetical protein